MPSSGAFGAMPCACREIESIGYCWVVNLTKKKLELELPNRCPKLEEAL
jgi:hypothetical protein